MSERPSAGASWENWRRSELPVWRRIQVAMRNNAIKARRRSSCCGNHGEPGC